MESIFGSVVFEVIGAGTKWLSYKARNSFLGEACPSFKAIYSGKEKAGSAEHLYGGISNILVGMVVVVILLVIFVDLASFINW